MTDPGAEEFEILDEMIAPLAGPARSADPTAPSARERRTGDDDLPPIQPIFLLSCNRAGSTLLRFILDTHPDVYCPPELFLGQAAHSLAIFLCGLEGRDSYFEAEGKIYVTEAMAETLRTLLSDRLSAHTARRGKRLWCEKTPQNVLHLKLLNLLFPRAKHLCLYRHCLDVVASALQMAGRISAIQRFIYNSSGHAVTGTIRWWCEMTRAMLEQERAHPGRCFRLRYEDLVENPARVAAPMFSFLEVPWEEKVLASVFSAPHDYGYEDPTIRFTDTIHSGSVGNGASLSLAGVPDDVLASMRRLLLELGYPEVNRRSPATPKPGPAALRPFSTSWFFETFLPGKIAAMPEVAARIDHSFRFAVDGPESGSWLVDLRPAGSRVQRTNAAAQSTILISAADLADISRGALNSSKAVLEGRVKIVGAVDFTVLEQLVQILRQPASPA
ncbi:MAG TPA: sulfotransferase [Thermoanaerobaculia bacterium]|nr:sulfotransferase [Thermoanaerobaculia bacterium]